MSTWLLNLLKLISFHELLTCIFGNIIIIHKPNTPSIGATCACSEDCALVPDLFPPSPSPPLNEWADEGEEESLGLFDDPRAVRGLDGSLFLSESDELPSFFCGKGWGGLRGCKGLRGWRGFSSLSEVLVPRLPVNKKKKHKTQNNNNYVKTIKVHNCICIWWTINFIIASDWHRFSQGSFILPPCCV